LNGDSMLIIFCLRIFCHLLRIEAYFNAAFHLIEIVAARYKVHIDIHKNVRKVLETNPDIFGDKSESIWKAFWRLEREIRPGQVYGGLIDGEKLKEAEEVFNTLEKLILGV
jgi:hypothetical protein